MSDIQRYGTGDLAGDYYFVRVIGSSTPIYGGMENAYVYFIDDLGGAQRIAPGSDWTPEEIAELPTLEEAITQHLGPAFDKAEANRQTWLKSRKNAPPPPAPEPISPATQRFLHSDDELGWDLGL